MYFAVVLRNNSFPRVKQLLVGSARLATVFLLLAGIGCKGDTPTPPPDSVATALAANSSTSVTGVAGAIVAPAPSVVVTDQNGAALGGVTVTFSVASGGGSVAGGTAATNPAGVATVSSWTLGPSVGTNVITAASGMLASVSFTATSTAGPAASVAKNGGDNQTGLAGSAVAVPPSVILKDANGNPTPGVSVTFAVTSGGGSVTGATAMTNAAGVAQVGSWNLGLSAGANILTANSASLNGVAFTATANAGAAASIARNTGDNQTAVAGSAVSIPPSVIVKDANGNPANGVSVTFAVASGGGSVSGATASTNSSGIATVGSWNLGPVVGTNSLDAKSGALSVAFTASSTAGAATSLAKNSGDNQSGVAGSAVSSPPSVIVKDANGNPKSGVSVTFAVASGGGSVTGGASVTNAAGVAAVGSWTLGSSAGANSLSATSAGLPTATFTALGLSAQCAARLTHTVGTDSNGSLSSSDCQSPDGSFIDFYSTSVPQAGAYFFREGAAFDAYLLLATPDGTTIAENDDEIDTGTNSGIKALLPSGNYLLGATTFGPGVTGDYAISSRVAPTDVANCEHVFVVRGIATQQNITTTDCNLANAGATPIYSDGYLIFIAAGTSVTITMSSTNVDSFLQLVKLDGTLVTENDNIDSNTKNARVTYTSTQSGYYAIFARSVPTTTQGPYTLTIQ